MRRKFLGIWLILAAAMLFSIASLMPVASVAADEPETSAVLGSDESDIGPDGLIFVDPYQYTSMYTEPFEPLPGKYFRAGRHPLWMHCWVNITGPMPVTVYYLLINLITHEVNIYDGDYNPDKPGTWRLGLGWPGGAPFELKGVQLLIAFAVSPYGVAKCPKPWWFVVY